MIYARTECTTADSVGSVEGAFGDLDDNRGVGEG